MTCAYIYIYIYIYLIYLCLLLNRHYYCYCYCLRLLFLLCQMFDDDLEKCLQKCKKMIQFLYVLLFLKFDSQFIHLKSSLTKRTFDFRYVRIRLLLH